MKPSLNNTESPIQKFKETIGQKYGIIICGGPGGERYEARTLREAEELTGVPHNTIDYALKHSGRTRGGWNFERRLTS